MTSKPEVPAWLGRALALARQPPTQARWLLEIDGRIVGSVLPSDARWIAALPGFALEDELLTLQPACGFDASAALAQVAAALRDAGRAPHWRNELLPVCADDGTRVATLERACVRSLGVATRAVHLNGYTPDGRMWLQQRAHNKANDPGMWDTLVGGMIALEPLGEALRRETFEEAGLELAALRSLVRRHSLRFERPVEGEGWLSDGSPSTGWLSETIAVFDAIIPEGMTPENQDGEVAQFRCVSLGELEALLDASVLTMEAALVIAESLAHREHASLSEIAKLKIANLYTGI